jgi:hypothetical protein
MRLRLERAMEEIQETSEFPAGALRIKSWQAVNKREQSRTETSIEGQ